MSAAISFEKFILSRNTNFNATNPEMFRVNTFVTERLVLFHTGENGQNKQAAEEIDSFPSLKLSKHELV